MSYEFGDIITFYMMDGKIIHRGLVKNVFYEIMYLDKLVRSGGHFE